MADKMARRPLIIFIAQRCNKSNDLHVLVLRVLIVDDMATQRAFLLLSHTTFRVDEAVVSKFEIWVRPPCDAQGRSLLHDELLVDSLHRHILELGKIDARSIDHLWEERRELGAVLIDDLILFGVFRLRVAALQVLMI